MGRYPASPPAAIRSLKVFRGDRPLGGLIGGQVGRPHELRKGCAAVHIEIGFYSCVVKRRCVLASIKLDRVLHAEGQQLAFRRASLCNSVRVTVACAENR